MASFEKGGSGRAPFGKNEYRRSTQDIKYDSYTVAGSTVAVETIDGVPQKILQSGETMAAITSGAESGKIGPFQAGATDGRQTLANIVGVNDTFLPYQLMDRDVEVAVAYEATLRQAWCFERDASGVRIALSNTTADAMVSKKSLSILFK